MDVLTVAIALFQTSSHWSQKFFVKAQIMQKSNNQLGRGVILTVEQSAVLNSRTDNNLLPPMQMKPISKLPYLLEIPMRQL